MIPRSSNPSPVASSAPPTVEIASPASGVVAVTLGGEWTQSADPPSFAGVRGRILGSSGGAPRIVVDASGVGRSDSTLVSFLLQLARETHAQGGELDLEHLDAGVRQLLDLALAVPVKEDAKRLDERYSFFFRVGTASLDLVGELRELFAFIGEMVFAFGRLLRGRARFRRQDFWITVQACSLESLPIVTLISLLIGMILAFVGNVQLANFGASIYVANLVAIAMGREMGALMTGIIMSGRIGAAFAAQIGTMKVTEEVDALRTFGFDPVDYLVLPRMLALMLMMPLLTVYANFIGVFGGFIVGMIADLSWDQYLNQTVGSLSWMHAWFGVFKSVFFGIVIAGSGCLRGMQCGNSSSAVGVATTRAVVTSITAIIVLDAFFALVTTLLKI